MRLAYLLRNTNEGDESPWIVPQKINRLDVTIGVRVKPCGKSARLGAVMYLVGKPHSEQDKVGRLQVSCS